MKTFRKLKGFGICRVEGENRRVSQMGFRVIF